MADTLVDHHASRRVMEKVGMRPCGTKQAEEGGVTMELVTYELWPRAVDESGDELIDPEH